MAGLFIFAVLDTKQRYTLGKAERLKSRNAIEAVFKNGKSFSIFPFRIVHIISIPKRNIAGSQVQAGFSVSTRYFKKAVDRNRIKRLMRESWRLQKNPLDEQFRNQAEGTNLQFHIFIIYTGNELPVYQQVFEKTGIIIKRLIRILNENNQAGA